MRVLISGYYGSGNLGDEAVLAGLLGELRRQAPEWRVTVLSGDVRRTEQQHGVAAVPRWPVGAVAEAVGRADLVVSGGGGLLQDATSLRSLLYYAGVLWLARQRGKRTAIVAQSIGPLRTRVGRWLARQAAERAALVTVRDEPSARLLREIGVSRPVEVTADPAFLVEPAEGQERAGIGLALREWPGGEEALAALIQGVRRWLESRGETAALFPFHSPRDVAPSERAAGVLGERARLVRLGERPEEACGIVAGMGLVVGVRLHALILASVAGVPWVSVSYDPKVTGFAEAAGMTCLTPAELTVDAAFAAIEETWEQREAKAEMLRSRLAEWRALARRNVELLVQVGSGAVAGEQG